MNQSTITFFKDNSEYYDIIYSYVQSVSIFPIFAWRITKRLIKNARIVINEESGSGSLYSTYKSGELRLMLGIIFGDRGIRKFEIKRFRRMYPSEL